MDSVNESKSSFTLDKHRFYSFFANPIDYYFKSGSSIKVKMEREALSNYNNLLREATEDCNFIRITLRQFNSEFETSIENKEKFCQEHQEACKILDNGSKSFPFSQSSKNSVTSQKLSVETQNVLCDLQDLLGSYPTSDVSSSSTVQDIENAYKNLEEHHEKTVFTACSLFPILRDRLNCTSREPNTDKKTNFSL